MSTNMSAEDRLVRSRVRLLMEYPFFGTLALHLKLVERPDIKTGATDGKRYYYNPEFVDKLTEAEVNFLTVHEVLHPALGHLWRLGSRDRLIWNHATDYCINGMIIESDPSGQNFKMIEGGLYNEKFKGMFSEEIYDILISDPDYVQKAKAAEAAGEGGTLDDHSLWEDADGDGSGEAEDWKGRVVQASQVAEGKGIGKLPAAIRRMIKDLVAPQKNWRELLAEFVQQEISDYGWTPADKRFFGMSDIYSTDIILPDFSEEVDVVKNIVFAIDTSGSIGGKEMKTFISECVGCINQYGGKVKGHLIYCDAQIGAIYDLEDAEQSVPVGGGGTRFEPVFDWVEENLEECAGVVYLTDGMGSYPKQHPYYPVLWVLTHDYDVPWGRTTRIKV